MPMLAGVREKSRCGIENQAAVAPSSARDSMYVEVEASAIPWDAKKNLPGTPCDVKAMTSRSCAAKKNSKNCDGRVFYSFWKQWKRSFLNGI